ncbi:prephenate dehydrogenase [Collinsella sp. AGMB00827]|uniref:Prephenate dehydrogenase n=1 Tax=Collinsella ureilytica TaxID=2869515 RepID=A0ABS7MLA2_9ACTN|nr:prephenate dehydrogenase [Collinsella urealyticum]MBY4798077.1 prephenate dehydrogenase [Collinsella urealyticum]
MCERTQIGILGLGLIGGSLARAYAQAGWKVVGADTDPDTMAAARVDTISGVLDEHTAPGCDLIILATYPEACLRWLTTHAPLLGEHPIVIDTAGIKSSLCAGANKLAHTWGFSFCGAHPMAGTEQSGFAFARANLFVGAPLVLTPEPSMDDMVKLKLLDRIRTLVQPAGFGSISITTPEEHDRLIAYTSQLAHVVSNAYVKSPTARSHHGFSAGSYRDLTRVAELNAPMWTELMMANRDALSYEIKQIIDQLSRYHVALQTYDSELLLDLLSEGDQRKRELDDSLDDPERTS